LEYQTVFDIALEKPSWTSAAFAAGIVPIALGFAYKERAKPVALMLALACAFFGALFSIVSYTESRESLRQLKFRIASGDYEQAEGQVTRFVADASDGRTPARFTVGNQQFEVFRYQSTAAFKDTPSAGGPDLSGKCVVVRSIAGTGEIVFLAVASPPCRDQRPQTNSGAVR